ncbi:hypothetical protein SAMN05192583_0890 [Sphingomonas gellani]|uniref:Uncharacterized protein n=1 Tax=Sphingomonas gellani TaxID=1166340 RepID=A0A1H7ZYT2_9SPHN|nr:hypothetical protein [Sphingomonas gellani]SEM62874.1 hypothetical protein SAMN05192583_0890 [Sphingomonas gellani]
MSYALGSPVPVTKTLVDAAGDRPAVTVTFNAQPSPLSLRAARRAVATILRDGQPNVAERAGDAFTAEIIRHNILAWTGIVGADLAPIEPTHDRDLTDAEGKVTGVEPGSISAFLTEPRLVEAADREYVLPWSERDAEKNGFAPSLNGTSAGATPGQGTATSPAKRGRKGAAGTKTQASRPARTKSTKPGRTRASVSGN